MLSLIGLVLPSVQGLDIIINLPYILIVDGNRNSFFEQVIVDLCKYSRFAYENRGYILILEAYRSLLFLNVACNDLFSEIDARVEVLNGIEKVAQI